MNVLLEIRSDFLSTVFCVDFPFPILFALLINTIEGVHYKKVAQTIVNLPHFIS